MTGLALLALALLALALLRLVAREVLMRRGSCLGTQSAGFLRAVFDG